MKFLKNTVKTKLRRNKLTVGSWLNLPSLEVSEIMAKSDFEFLVIDAEHGSMDLETIQKIVMIIEGCGTLPFVRIEENSPVIIKRVLETGCYGVIVPMVNNKADAAKAVKSIYYPPKGIRGAGLSRAQDYGLRFDEYKQWCKDNVVLVAQIEHMSAINNLEEIISLEEIDATIIGPYDLSASLGCPGELDNRKVVAAIDEYIDICKKHKKSAGVHVIDSSAQAVTAKIEQGFSFVVFSLDMLFLGNKLKDELSQIDLKLLR